MEECEQEVAMGQAQSSCSVTDTWILLAQAQPCSQM